MGLNCSEQGEQPLYSSFLWDIDPLAFSRLGWAAGVNFHIPWFHTCITNCRPEPNSPQAVQTYKTGRTRMGLGTLRGMDGEGNG